MWKHRVLSLVIISLGALSGCATTSISDYTDPNYKDTTFNRVAVWAETSDLTWRQELEREMHSAITKYSGAEASMAIDIAPPTRGFTSEETFQLLAGADIQAVLLLVMTDTEVDTSYSTNPVTGTLGTDTRLFGTSSVNLIDLESLQIAWTADTSTSGNAQADWDDVRRSISNKVVKRLLELNFIAPPPTTN